MEQNNPTNYLSVNALSIKQAMIDTMVANGVFKGNEHTGQNINALIDLIAGMKEGLLYYLNRTSTESTFDAQVYENINRIVKFLDYKPIGKQTSMLSFLMSANSSLPIGLYTIPRYSSISIGQIKYSFNEDIVFSKTTTSSETFTDLSNEKYLLQGEYVEYPSYIAKGDDYELMYLIPGENVIIDHFNIDVYVKNNNKWDKWERTQSLYLNKSVDKVYEIRYNENKNYEIVFGNDINGKKLIAGDTVQLYYLRSNGSDGEVGIGTLNNKVISPYTTIIFDEIVSDVAEPDTTFLPTSLYNTVSLQNNTVSTPYSTEETVDEIKKNAPATFRSQYRLVTSTDYENYIKTNFSNFIHDIKSVDNFDYLTKQLKYYNEIGLSNPNQVSNVLFNQIQYSDACNFSNVYLITVPKASSLAGNKLVYLNPSQKQLIINSMKNIRAIGQKPILLDPIYIAFSLGLENNDVSSESIEDTMDNTQILIEKDSNSKRYNMAIKNDVYKIIYDYFLRTNCSLSQLIAIDQLSANILGISGVKKLYMQRLDNTNILYEGLSFITWNSIYKELDKNVIQNNIRLDYFKFPYYYNIDNLLNQISVTTNITMYEGIEY